MAQMPGITTKELMARIGHSSPRAALIYQHATAERDREVATFLEGRLEAMKPATPRIVALRTDSKEDPRFQTPAGFSRDRRHPRAEPPP